MTNKLEHFKKLKAFSDLKKDMDEGNFFHSILFSCEDAQTLEAVSTVVAMMLVCETKEPCFSCGDCIKVLKKSHPDVFFIKGDKFLTENAMQISDNAFKSPMIAACKVFVIVGFENATVAAQNKLLKIIEEPPKDTYFLFCSINLEKVLPTIKSRCKSVAIAPFSADDLNAVIRDYSGKEVCEIMRGKKGYIGEALKFFEGSEIVQSYDFALSVVKEMKSSKDVLRFSSAFSKNKKEFLTKLTFLNSFYSDILRLLADEAIPIENENLREEFVDLSKSWTGKALVKVLKNFIKARKEFDLNVSPQLICDNLLLTILEEKYYATKSN
ncbi:MAG: DNA polymerase III subunit delta' C-terminal domain-containing protein [Clostridia bacterium]